MLLFGSRFCQPLSVSPALAIASMSNASANVTTSASRPSMTACLTARTAVRGPDRHGLTRLVSVRCKRGVELPVELPRRIV